MLKKIHLCFHHGLRVKGEKEICFSKQVNIIIGPNGSGKSTVLRSIYECGDCMRSEDSKTVYRFFDSELNNPHATEKKFTGYRGNVLKTRAVFSSHGEIMRSVLANFQFNSRDCLLVDEPDAGADIDGVMMIKNAFEKITKKGCQVIIATHHPFFLKNANLIELEHHYAEKLISLYKNV